jgi:predicted choloylglycine hydrolase
MRKTRRRKIIKYGVALIFLLFGIFVVFIEEIFEFSPPAIQDITSITLLKAENHENYKSLANCWSKEARGVNFLFLYGDPFLQGWAAGKLTGHSSAQLEEALLNRAYEVIDSKAALWFLRKSGYVLNADLPDYFPVYMQKEVYGFASAIDNAHPELGSAYFRSLYYQTAHDLAHQIMENFLSEPGCTSFAAWGSATEDGHLIIGRNFDFEIEDLFDRFKLVQIIHPEKGIPFISISWPGMYGVVSGVNKELISVTLNAAKSDHAAWKGTPVVVMSRRVLQEASTLQEAVALFRSLNSYISESFLVADGKTGEVVVVEKTPQLTLIRKPEPSSFTLLCANHFLSPDLQNHKKHQAFVKEGSSLSRLERLQELLDRHKGKISPAVAATILRDYKFLRDVDFGMGHLHSINPSICSHSIILDLTAGILWVSQGPYQANAYLPVHIQSIFKQSPEESIILTDKIIPPDRHISPEKVAEIQLWRSFIKKWQKQGKEVSLEELQKDDDVFQKTNPQHFLTMVVSGDLAFRQGKIEHARELWTDALKRKPYPEWAREIHIRLTRLENQRK